MHFYMEEGQRHIGSKPSFVYVRVFFKYYSILVIPYWDLLQYYTGDLFADPHLLPGSNFEPVPTKRYTDSLSMRYALNPLARPIPCITIRLA
jgi:hypothetical protein